MEWRGRCPAPLKRKRHRSGQALGEQAKKIPTDKSRDFYVIVEVYIPTPHLAHKRLVVSEEARG